MTQVLLRIAVWLLVFGIGYLLFGPQLFDSSRSADPFGGGRPLYLPPAKSPRLIELENLLDTRRLEGAEAEEYRALVQERQSNFWKGGDVSVEDALAGVNRQRKAHLAAILVERGLTDEEVSVFLTVAARDHASVFDDRE